MLDNTYYNAGIQVDEYFVKVSDGVELKIIDFIPENDAPEKPVIVFVAGWISLVSGWKDVLRRLTSTHRTLYIETREKKSAVLPENKNLTFTIQRMSLDIEEILTKIIPVERTFLMTGSSLGSTVVLDYMSRNFRQPDKAMLIAPVSDFPFPLWLLFIIRFIPAGFYSVVRPILKWYLRNIRLDKKKEPEQVEKYEGTLDAAEPARLKANALAIKDYSLWERLDKIKPPVTIIGAETDTHHGYDVLEKMVSMMPDADFELMKSNKETHSEKAADLILAKIEDQAENQIKSS
jgi:pimeloyl-ACP methyl ester carboxylesterase